MNRFISVMTTGVEPINRNFYSEKIVLTFDLNKSDHKINDILCLLKSKDITATFFISGKIVKDNLSIVDNIMSFGHNIGNLSFNNRNLQFLDKEEIEDEIKSLNTLFKRKYDYSLIFFRPPDGVYNANVLNVANSLGHYTILWNKDNSDVKKLNITKGSIVRINIENIETIEIEKYINRAIKQGYSFTNLEDLFVK